MHSGKKVILGLFSYFVEQRNFIDFLTIDLLAEMFIFHVLLCVVLV